MPEPTEPQQNRRDNGPLTDRGAARKRALLDAARSVFEEKGFIDTRVSDIVRQARVAHGTFYTYFDTKEAVFSAVAHDVTQQMLEDMSVTAPVSPDFGERVRETVQRFVEVYRPHAKMLGLMEQLGTVSPAMRDLRIEVREAFVQRTRRGIERAKAAGSADPDLDTEYIAETLGVMLEYSCYVSFCLGKDYDEVRLVDALAVVWSRAMGTVEAGQSGQSVQ